jgi:trk system potassium uptake protein
VFPLLHEAGVNCVQGNYDDSIGHFDSALIELICIFFMLIGAMNFALHFFAWRYRTLAHYFRDSEFRSLIAVAAVATAVVTTHLMRTGTYESFGEALVKSLFQVVSIGADAGFTSAEFAAWPGFVPVLLVFLSFIGGCAMSTGGGIKHVRLMLLLKQGMREVTRLVHPSAQVPVRVSGRAVPPRVMEAVWGFFSAYVAVFTVIMLLLMAAGAMVPRSILITPSAGAGLMCFEPSRP